MSSDVTRLARFVTLADKQQQSERSNDLHLSREMQAAVAAMLSASSDGYLSDHVASPLAAPLTAEAVFSPSSALLNSKHARVKQNAAIVPAPLSPAPPTLAREDYASDVQPFAVRLKALWLKRHAQVGLRRGQHIAALSTLQQASATLADKSCEGNFREIDNELVFDNFFNYDASIHRAAFTVQRVYKARFKLRTRSAIVISTTYRCFIAYKKYQALLRLRNASATLIQLQFRAYRSRLNRRAKHIQRWYHALKLSWVGWLARKQRLSSTAIQAWWRCTNTRRKYLRERAAVKNAATLIQRHTRGYLAREGHNGLNLVRRFRRYRVVNRYARGKLARLQVTHLWEYVTSCQEEIRRQEAAATSLARYGTARLDFSAYAASKGGQFHFTQLGRRLKSVDNHYAALPPDREPETLEHFVKAFFNLLDIRGIGRLDDDQVVQLFRALKLPSLSTSANSEKPPSQLKQLVSWIRYSDHAQRVLANIRQRKYAAHNKRARAIVHRQFRDLNTALARAAFRERYRANLYECCACLQVFHKFRSYYDHIKDGCASTGQPCMFYSPFTSGGGRSQRDAELTIRFLKDQRAYIQHAVTRACYQVSLQLGNRYQLLWRYHGVLSGLAAGFGCSTLVENWQQLSVSELTRSAHLKAAVATQLVELMQVDDSVSVPVIVCEYATDALNARLPPEWTELEHIQLPALQEWVEQYVPLDIGSWQALCQKLALLRLRVLLLSRAVYETSVLAALEFETLRTTRPSATHCDEAEYNRNYLRDLLFQSFDLAKAKVRLRDLQDEWEHAAYQTQIRPWYALPSLSFLRTVRVFPEQRPRVPLLLTVEHHPQLRNRVRILMKLRNSHSNWQEDEGLTQILDEHLTNVASQAGVGAKWSTVGPNSKIRACMASLVETKATLLEQLLNVPEHSSEPDTYHPHDRHERLAKLVQAEQHWKHTGMWDVFEEEATSRATQLLCTPAGQQYLRDMVMWLDCLAVALQGSRQQMTVHAFDHDDDGWLGVAGAKALVALSAGFHSPLQKLVQHFPAAISLHQVPVNKALTYLSGHTPLLATLTTATLARKAATARIVEDQQRRMYRATLVPGLQVRQFESCEQIVQVSCEASATRIGRLFLATPYGKLKLKADAARCKRLWEELQADGIDDALPTYLFNIFTLAEEMHANEARRTLAAEAAGRASVQQFEIHNGWMSLEEWQHFVGNCSIAAARRSTRNFEQDAERAVLARLRQQALRFRQSAHLSQDSELYDCCLVVAADRALKSPPTLHAEAVDGINNNIETFLRSRQSFSMLAVTYILGSLDFTAQEQRSLCEAISQDTSQLPNPLAQVSAQEVIQALDKWTPSRWAVWRPRSWQTMRASNEGVLRAQRIIELTAMPTLLDRTLFQLLIEMWHGRIELPEELRLSW